MASLQLQHKQLDRLHIADAHNQTEPSSVGSKVSISRTLGADPMATDEQKQLQRQFSSPFIRQDIFYTGSISTLHEYKTSTDMTAYIQVVFLLFTLRRFYRLLFWNAIVLAGAYLFFAGLLQPTWDFSMNEWMNEVIRSTEK